MGRRSVAAIGLAVTLTVSIGGKATRAQALDPPPADSLAAVIEQVKIALAATRRIDAIAPLGAERVAALGACDALVARPPSCDGFAPAPCSAALLDIHRALTTGRPRLDALGDASAARAAARVATAALRLRTAAKAIAAGSCTRIAPPGGHPTEITPSRDGRTLIAKPLTALRAGRRYALVASGLTPAERGAAAASVVPAGARAGASAAGLTVRPATFLGLAEQPRGVGTEDVDRSKLAALLSRLETQAAVMPGLGSFVAVRFTLPEPLRAEQIERLEVYFAPLDRAPESDVVATFRTLDARAGLLAYRARLRALPCGQDGRVAAAPEPSPSNVGAPVRAFALHVPSLDVLAPATGASPLGTDAAAAPRAEVPALLALPDAVRDATPLVIAVNGHMGTARQMLALGADALRARGMALLVLDLPEQGLRGRPGSAILDVRDPAALSRALRQAATDVLAAIRLARHCGIALPDGRLYRPRQVRYLGYSLGAMVGTMVRAVEPDLGATVLIAPGGDVAGWLMLRLAPELGARYVSCLGGADHGKSCFGSGACAAPGACVVDPGFELLYQALDGPYEQVAAPADPLSFATERTGTASHAPLLVLTGGRDPALHPALAGKLADAYGMRPSAPHVRRGPGSLLVQWPGLGHDLMDHAPVRAQAFAFLASGGHERPSAGGGDGAPKDG